MFPCTAGSRARAARCEGVWGGGATRLGAGLFIGCAFISMERWQLPRLGDELCYLTSPADTVNKGRLAHPCLAQSDAQQQPYSVLEGALAQVKQKFSH